MYCFKHSRMMRRRSQVYPDTSSDLLHAKVLSCRMLCTVIVRRSTPQLLGHKPQEASVAPEMMLEAHALKAPPDSTKHGRLDAEP